MTRDQLLKFHGEMTAKARSLMEAKNHDYTGSDGGDPFANFRRVQAMGICSTEQGFLVRMTDKLSRLSTFAQSGKLLVKDEGVTDTCMDLANYAILFAAYVRSLKEGAE